MALSRLARFHPVALLGVITLGLMALGNSVPLEYDDGGIGAMWFVIMYILTWPFRVASQLMTKLNGGDMLPNHWIFTVLVGAVFYACLDALVVWTIRRRAERRKGSEE